MSDADLRIDETLALIRSTHERWIKSSAPLDHASWHNTLQVAMARFEAGIGVAPQPADFEQMQVAEFQEIQCRRKLLDPDFQARVQRLEDCVGFRVTLDDQFPARVTEAAGRDGAFLHAPTPADRNRFAGLAFSGGGIRSATFNLGVLQGLAAMKLLPQFDYLSTASGGGYIGTWLAAWIKRSGWKTVNEMLDPENSSDPVCAGRNPIQFLREYSNYLTPELGILSGDTWATISIWLRNTMLNLVILIASLSMLLLIPRCGLWIQLHWGHAFNTGPLFLLLYAVEGVAFWMIWRNLEQFTCRSEPESTHRDKSIPWFSDPRWIMWLIVLPVFIAATTSSGHVWAVQNDIELPFLLGKTSIMAIFFGLAWFLSGLFIYCAFHYIPRVRTSLDLALLALAGLFGGYPIAVVATEILKHQRLWISIACCFSVVLWAIAWNGGFPECFTLKRRQVHRSGPWSYLLGLLTLLLFSSVTGLVSSQFLRGIAYVFRLWDPADPAGPHFPWRMTIFGPSLMIAAVSLSAYLFIGLMGRFFPDGRREWISRLAGSLLLLSFAWIALFGCAFYAWTAIERLSAYLGAFPTKTVLSAIWTAVTWFSVQAGKSQTTGKPVSPADKSSMSKELLAKGGPYLFIAGMFTAVSIGLEWLLVTFTPPAPSHFVVGMEGVAIWIALVCALGVMCLSLTVDVNEFSMHNFYRNRLVRCYLGASNLNRQPNGYTGFAANDDIQLAKFAPSATTPGAPPYAGPYQILNTALNLTAGERLAYQERKAASFTFSPRYCGFDTKVGAGRPAPERVTLPGYQPTDRYAYSGGGIHIGSAMSISGAAMNPNRGYHSSPATAFLLTVFNVRLGWWLGNPTQSPYWQYSSPLIGLGYLLKELFGLATDTAGYVYLSDGGHFDNLGIYELVKRRCRVIVACDAEEDAAFRFEGLGNAIRKCRADLGIEIEIDVEQLRLKRDSNLSGCHCVVGKIHYEQVTQVYETGTLIYLKSSLTGDEPTDLLEYSLRQPEFPHQTTLDQFFDESQFESYRRLGYHVARRTFETAIEDATAGLGGEPPPLKDGVFLEDLAHALRQRWYPASPAIQAAFTRHTNSLSELNQRLRSDPALRFLDRQFYPEWQDLAAYVPNERLRAIIESGAQRRQGLEPPDPLWIPTDREQIRAGFYFCVLLLHLMENVYLDLDLERYADHPDDQGWINLFHHWVESGMFRVAYSITASTYGSRFRAFCKREMDLDAGDVKIGPADENEMTVRERSGGPDPQEHRLHKRTLRWDVAGGQVAGHGLHCQAVPLYVWHCDDRPEADRVLPDSPAPAGYRARTQSPGSDVRREACFARRIDTEGVPDRSPAGACQTVPRHDRCCQEVTVGTPAGSGKSRL